MGATEFTEEGMRWDLGDLYEGPEDPRIEKDLREGARQAVIFDEANRGRLASLDGSSLARVLAEYETLSELLQRPSFYASLLFAGNTQDPVAQRLHQRTRELTTETANLLVFFQLELLALDSERVSWLLTFPEMQNYGQYLERLRRFKPHTLNEREERIVNQKNLTGRSAFEQLYEELEGSLRFKVTVDGTEKQLASGEVMALLRDPRRELREHAFSSFLETHGQHALVISTVFNNVFLDHRLDCELRNYKDVVMPTHLANGIDPETVEAMLQTVEAHYKLAQEYFRLKARMIGIEKLKNSDLYAPVNAAAEKISFSEARSVVLSAFQAFDARFAAIAEEFFEKRWIDAELRVGKRSGAFCASLSPSHHPYVLSSYMGTGRDVSTLAHELGHGIHYQLSRVQTWVNHDAPLVLAETASVFAEILLVRHLLSRTDDASVRRALLCSLLDDIYGTVFRQTALTRFEIAAHLQRREGPLSPDDLSALWLAEQSKVFGDSVEMIPAYRWGWTYIAHFIHSRFYCYSYSFGELLTLSLFQKYLDEGDSFVPGYIGLLEGGGSCRPDKALANLGIDINQKEFWNQAFRVVDSFLKELEQAL